MLRCVVKRKYSSWYWIYFRVLNTWGGILPSISIISQGLWSCWVCAQKLRDWLFTFLLWCYRIGRGEWLIRDSCDYVLLIRVTRTMCCIDTHLDSPDQRFWKQLIKSNMRWSPKGNSCRQYPYVKQYCSVHIHRHFLCVTVERNSMRLVVVVFSEKAEFLPSILIHYDFVRGNNLLAVSLLGSKVMDTAGPCLTSLP